MAETITGIESWGSKRGTKKGKRCSENVQKSMGVGHH